MIDTSARGRAKSGFEAALFPYKAGIDKMSEGIAVSFFALKEIADGRHG